MIDEAARDLPNVAATSEAIAVRLRRAGVSVEWREPVIFPSARAYVRFCHDRGRSSVAVARADPSLVAELQLRAELERVVADLPAPPPALPRPQLPMTYLAVSALLIVIWALTGAGYFWPIWPMLGWGVWEGPRLARVGLRACHPSASSTS